VTATEMLAKTQTVEARDALQGLLEQAASDGYDFHFRKSAAKAVELVDVDRERPFSAIANKAHLLFYIRQPALRANPGLFSAAEATFGSVKPNSKGEYRVRVRSPQELSLLIGWLTERKAWKVQR